jgi:hypothetical protein
LFGQCLGGFVARREPSSQDLPYEEFEVPTWACSFKQFMDCIGYFAVATAWPIVKPIALNGGEHDFMRLPQIITMTKLYPQS